MATAEYAEREDFFYKARIDALALLDDPELKTPEHHYIRALRSMIDYAVLGVIDARNGLIHAERTPFHKCVVLTPVLDSDIVACPIDVTITNGLCKQFDSGDSCSIAVVKDASAACDVKEGSPVIISGAMH